MKNEEIISIDELMQLLPKIDAIMQCMEDEIPEVCFTYSENALYASLNIFLGIALPIQIKKMKEAGYPDAFVHKQYDLFVEEIEKLLFKRCNIKLPKCN